MFKNIELGKPRYQTVIWSKGITKVLSEGMCRRYGPVGKRTPSLAAEAPRGGEAPGLERDDELDGMQTRTTPPAQFVKYTRNVQIKLYLNRYNI